MHKFQPTTNQSIPQISVILITKNEITNLPDCLESIKWAKEIIVVDSGSTDGTQKLCIDFGCNVIETDWPGFGAQKNRALKEAKESWVFSIDADERVSHSLLAEMINAVKNSEISGYHIPRRSSYCGRFIKFSGWQPDYVLRLFRKSEGFFSDDLVHEKVVLSGRTDNLESPLIHYPFNNLEQVINKLNQYSSLGAQQLFAQGKRATLFKALFKAIWSFLRSYIFRLGCLDKQEGLMLAISNAEGTYYKYAKLALLCRSKDSKKK